MPQLTLELSLANALTGKVKRANELWSVKVATQAKPFAELIDNSAAALRSRRSAVEFA